MYDWKKENIKNRYIDDLTDDEAYHIAWLILGKPEDFIVLNIIRDINHSNIPHVTINCQYFEPCIKKDIEANASIFHNLNVYRGKFHSALCQKEVFEYFKQIGIS